MIEGRLMQDAVRTGLWFVRHDKKQLNYYLDADSTLEVEVEGNWEAVTIVQGPGGIRCKLGKIPIEEVLPARLTEISDKVVQIRR